jgi:hypothetical protein
MKYLILSTAIVVSSWIQAPAQANGTCTAITQSGKEYVGCSRQSNKYILNQAVNGYASFSAAQQNPHNPGCYDIGENGVIAFCSYRR